MSNLIIDKARICGHLKSLMDALTSGMERIDHEAGDQVALNVIASSINETIRKSSQNLGNLIEVIEVKAKEAEAQAAADKAAQERIVEIGAVDESHPMHSKERQAAFRELSGFQRQPWHSDGAFMTPDGVIHERK